ncbi:MAG: hypothetical protein K2X01_02675 [Cyanobacteria bacterium]|nr:hypothetical protein [Cyanobacteriota bacterium]
MPKRQTRTPRKLFFLFSPGQGVPEYALPTFMLTLLIVSVWSTGNMGPVLANVFERANQGSHSVGETVSHIRELGTVVDLSYAGPIFNPGPPTSAMFDHICQQDPGNSAVVCFNLPRIGTDGMSPQEAAAANGIRLSLLEMQSYLNSFGNTNLNTQMQNVLHLFQQLFNSVLVGGCTSTCSQRSNLTTAINNLNSAMGAANVPTTVNTTIANILTNFSNIGYTGFTDFHGGQWAQSYVYYPSGLPPQV